MNSVILTPFACKQLFKQIVFFPLVFIFSTTLSGCDFFFNAFIWALETRSASRAFAVDQTSDGGYIIVGDALVHSDDRSDSDILVIKLDAIGDIEWEREYGGSADESATSVVQTNDGGYILAGGSSSADISGVPNNGANDGYLLKLDGSGNIEW